MCHCGQQRCQSNQDPIPSQSDLEAKTFQNLNLLIVFSSHRLYLLVDFLGVVLEVDDVMSCCTENEQFIVLLSF